MLKKKIWFTIILSIAYRLFENFYFELLADLEAYHNNDWFPIFDYGYSYSTYFILTVLFTIPTVIYYRNRYWYTSILILCTNAIFTFVEGMIGPYRYTLSLMDNLYFSFINDITAGILIGLFINLLIYQLRSMSVRFSRRVRRM